MALMNITLHGLLEHLLIIVMKDFNMIMIKKLKIYHDKKQMLSVMVENMMDQKHHTMIQVGWVMHIQILILIVIMKL